MVDRHGTLAATAVLTAVVVADYHVLAGEHDALVGHFPIPPQPHHRGAVEGVVDGANLQAVGGLDYLRLTLKHEHDSTPRRTYRERFVVLVEHQNAAIDYGSICSHLSAHRRSAGCTSIDGDALEAVQSSHCLLMKSSPTARTTVRRGVISAKSTQNRM